MILKINLPFVWILYRSALSLFGAALLFVAIIYFGYPLVVGIFIFLVLVFVTALAVVCQCKFALIIIDKDVIKIHDIFKQFYATEKYRDTNILLDANKFTFEFMDGRVYRIDKKFLNKIDVDNLMLFIKANPHQA